MKHIHLSNSSNITNVEPTDVQPNAVDLRVIKILNIGENLSLFKLGETEKKHRESTELICTEYYDFQQAWRLHSGKCYEIVFDNIVKIGPNQVGWVVSRSTLVRNGLFLVSGLYDSGYHGALGACLHVNGGDAIITKNARLGQFVLFDAEMAHKYNGNYGIGTEHDRKYS